MFGLTEVRCTSQLSLFAAALPCAEALGYSLIQFPLSITCDSYVYTLTCVMQGRNCKLFRPRYLTLMGEHVIQIGNFSANGHIENLVI